MIRYRWGDEDRRFGPFIWGPYNHGFYIGIRSQGDEDEGSFSIFRLSAFGWSGLVLLPAIIKPYREKVIASTWDEATVKRMGRNWYWQEYPREFSFSWHDRYVSVHYGRNTHDSSTDKQKGWFPPWQCWRHVRHSFYDLNGEHIADMPQRSHKLGVKDWKKNWEEDQAIEKSVPSRSFDFLDYDGEALSVETKIEEREWRLGEGKFKWLSLFRKPRIERYLNLEYSGETGNRKGSWKGGTVGRSIKMLPGELHEAAFKRSCDEQKMTFVGPTTVH